NNCDDVFHFINPFFGADDQRQISTYALSTQAEACLKLSGEIVMIVYQTVFEKNSASFALS
ncbi:MAG: hypothetical protein VW707_03100, partial [Candidatus Puniceispirillum sp.]